MLNKFEEIAVKVAAELHEDWRRNYVLANGNIPRIKPANDGTNREIDINVPYDQLTPHWQKENYEAACFVVKLIMLDGDIDDDHLACQVHNAWLKRNDWAKGGPLDVPYWDLPQEEKDKDLLHVQIGRKIIQNHLIEELDEDGLYDYDMHEECDAYQLGICNGKCNNCTNHSNFIPRQH